MENKKITPKQKEILRLLQNGYKCQFSFGRFFCFKNGKSIPAPVNSLDTLMDKGLLSYNEGSATGQPSYKLTEAGTSYKL